MTLPKSPRTVVVLAGWLGCRAKALEKYKSLYERLLGVDQVTVLACIAPPKFIVQTCMDQTETMDDMAQQLVNEIASKMERGKSRSSSSLDAHLYFHAFSNAGCILWERFRHHLLISSKSESSSDLLQRINGVIFDSCPIANLSLIREALKHCDWRDRAQVVRTYPDLDYLQREKLCAFADRFETMLREDPLPIPQLYLYSRNDLLTPHEFVRELVQCRRQMLPTIRIEDFSWDDSSHCAHLLRHPETYEQKLHEFIKRTHDTIVRSKL